MDYLTPSQLRPRAQARPTSETVLINDSKKGSMSAAEVCMMLWVSWKFIFPPYVQRCRHGVSGMTWKGMLSARRPCSVGIVTRLQMQSDVRNTQLTRFTIIFRLHIILRRELLAPVAQAAQ